MYIPDDAVSWSVYWSGYKPIDFTTAKIKSKPVYADDQDTTYVIYLPTQSLRCFLGNLFSRLIKMD
jgi:hypothetical protein